jgi:N-acetylglucosamine-6-phosphate deacetylase
MKVIDIHTHGIGGYDTRTAIKDHILKIAEIHGSYGVSEIIPAVYPAAINVMRENIEAIKKAIEKQILEVRNQIPPLNPPLGKGGTGGVNSEFKTQNSNLPTLPLARGGTGEFKREGSKGINQPSRIIGVHLEGPFLNPARCGALSTTAFVEPTEYNFKELIEGFEDIVKIITIAPEIKGAVSLTKKMSDKGIIVSMGHSDATYVEAEAGFHAGAKGITHIFNAMSGFHHREPGLAGFGLLNQDIYIEVIADPYHLHFKTFELIFKTKNPERIIIVSDTVKEAKISSPSSLPTPFKGEGWEREQGITDIHGRLSGGCMTITESSKRLIQMGYNEDTVTGYITKNPERYLSDE